MTRAALIIVDCQNDFLPPSGSLSVDEGDQILDPISQLLADSAFTWDIVVASEDYHPKGHISFAGTHDQETFSSLELEKPNGKKYSQMMWPDHCVQGTWGVEIEESLRKSLKAYTGRKLLARKGYDIDVEAYSAFAGYLSDFDAPKSPPEPVRPFDDSPNAIRNGELAQTFRKQNIEKVVIVGVALDVCANRSVAATAMESILSGYTTAILRPLTRGVRREKCEDIRTEFLQVGGVMLGEGNNKGSDWKEDLRSWLG